MQVISRPNIQVMRFRVFACSVTLAISAFTPGLASAHGDAVNARNVWSAWNWEPTILIPLGITLCLYLSGLLRVWRRAGWGRGVSYARAAAFLGGLASLFAALISPIDALSDDLLWMHMTQHLILIMISAPLLVLGKPLVPILWGLPSDWRRWLARSWNRSSSLQSAWRTLIHPVVDGALFTLVFLIWHVPPLYQAALSSDAIHAFEHTCFLVSGLLFWWAVIQPAAHRRREVGVPIALISTAVMEGSVLGALMTFSRTPWYPFYATSTRGWGLSPLEDQQLAGLIMWIPAGTIYLCVALGLLGAWFHQVDREEERRAYPLISDAGVPEARGEAAHS